MTKSEVLGNKEQVYLKDILENPNLSGGYTKTRSYSEKIDKLLKTPGSNCTEYQVNGVGLLKMVYAGRLDYIIEYSSGINFYKEELEKQFKSKTKVIILEDNKNDYIVSYTALPISDWGKKVQSDFNEMLKNVTRKDIFLNIFLDNYSQENEKKEIRRIYKNVFFNNL